MRRFFLGSIAPAFFRTRIFLPGVIKCFPVNILCMGRKYMDYIFW